MKTYGPTGKRYYKEYYGVPKWFVKRLSNRFNASLLNMVGLAHYIGKGMDGKKKSWTGGSFITDFERSSPYWKQEITEADFIIHFGGVV
jgi:hypothetical protein